MATFTEFLCDPLLGANINAGDNKPIVTSTNGGWSTTTNIYTAAAGTPFSGVNIGDFAALYLDGTAPAVYIARVTAIGGGGATLTLSATAKAGALVSTTPGVTCTVGGMWQGPNGASGFPFTLATLPSLTDAALDPPRINLKNNGTFGITAGLTTLTNGPLTVEGMTASPGDGGRATIDGGVSTIVLLTHSVKYWTWRDVILQNNGATLTNAGVTLSGTPNLFDRVIVNNVRGSGFNITGAGNELLECESYACNTSNTPGQAGCLVNQAGNNFTRCAFHHNLGTNNVGFQAGNACDLMDCIIAVNGSSGIVLTGSGIFHLSNCLSYGNGTAAGAHGLSFGGSNSIVCLDNCHWLNNSNYGILVVNTNNSLRLTNNGFFGNGTAPMGTALGIINDAGGSAASSSINYASDPTVDGAHGNFSLTAQAAKGTGRGYFSLTAQGIWNATTTSFPDVGPVQHADTGAAMRPAVLSPNRSPALYE